MYMWNMPVHAPMGIAQNYGAGAQVSQQITANALANQNQATANLYQAPLLQNQVLSGQINNQYLPQLDQNKVLNGQITNQYLPQIDQAGIDYQNAMTQWMPMNTLARMYSGMGTYGKAQAMAMADQSKYSPLRDSTGNAPGMVAGAQNVGNFLTMNPYAMYSMYANGGSPGSQSTSTQPQSSSQMSGQPGSSANSLVRPPMMMPPMSSQPASMGASAQPSAQAPVQPNGAPPGYSILNPLTHTLTDAQGNVTMPDDPAMAYSDQRSVAAAQRITDQIPALLNLPQFQNKGTEAKEMLESVGNMAGGNYQLPNQKQQGEAALTNISEGMLKAYQLNGTGQLQEAMENSLEPKDNESAIGYQNRVWQTKYVFDHFAQESKARLGQKIGLNDFNPNNMDQMSQGIKIGNYNIYQLTNLANQEGKSLPDVINAYQKLLPPQSQSQQAGAAGQ